MAQHSTDKDQVWLEPRPRPRGTRRTLDWKVFWRLIHTKKLWYGPKDVDVRAFFYTFHSLGSIVSSSCLCESAGSLLKHFSRGNPDTRRIVERTILRLAAVSGDGTDDAIILRTWLETVASPDKLNFIGSSMKAYNKNLERWPLGQGSKTIHGMRKAALNKKGSKTQWTVKRVKKIPRVAAKVLQVARLKASLHRWARAAAGDKRQQQPLAASSALRPLPERLDRRASDTAARLEALRVADAERAAQLAELLRNFAELGEARKGLQSQLEQCQSSTRLLQDSSQRTEARLEKVSALASQSHEGLAEMKAFARDVADKAAAQSREQLEQRAGELKELVEQRSSESSSRMEAAKAADAEQNARAEQLARDLVDLRRGLMSEIEKCLAADRQLEDALKRSSQEVARCGEGLGEVRSFARETAEKASAQLKEVLELRAGELKELFEKRAGEGDVKLEALRAQQRELREQVGEVGRNCDDLAEARRGLLADVEEARTFDRRQDDALQRLAARVDRLGASSAEMSQGIAEVRLYVRESAESVVAQTKARQDASAEDAKATFEELRTQLQASMAVCRNEAGERETRLAARLSFATQEAQELRGGLEEHSRRQEILGAELRQILEDRVAKVNCDIQEQKDMLQSAKDGLRKYIGDALRKSEQKLQDSPGNKFEPCAGTTALRMGKNDQPWGDHSYHLWRGSWPVSPRTRHGQPAPWKKGQEKGRSSNSFPAYDAVAPQQTPTHASIPVVTLDDGDADPGSCMVPSMQKALNTCRKAEQRLAKLLKDRRVSTQQWDIYVKKAKAAYVKEKTRHLRALEAFDKELRTAQQAQEEARQMVCMVAHHHAMGSAPAENTEVEGGAEWDAMIAEWEQEQEFADDGVLQRAMAAARNVSTPRPPQDRIPRTPVPESGARKGEPEPTYTAVSPDLGRARVDPYPATTPGATNTHTPLSNAQLGAAIPEDVTSPGLTGMRDRSSRSEQRKGIKEQSKTKPQVTEVHGNIEDKLQRRRALTPFGLPATTTESARPSGPSSTVPFVNDDDDESDFAEALTAEETARLMQPKGAHGGANAE
ncbi:unnamed protein product [Symbiodinium sp. CCMP2592]|nr:unnamed protein product [Symbiodinium sp. CCMP2592]